MSFDVVIVGGGPAGLSAALALGRARRRVLLCDAGPRRNAAAAHMHNFVTRDGTPPEEFRAIARQQLAAYLSVEVRDEPVAAVAGARGAFRVAVGGREVEARRVLLCTGMVDEAIEIEGARELWGRSIFQCPYCHGYEARDQRWGYLARGDNPMASHFALLMRGWTSQVTFFTAGAFELPAEARAGLVAAGIQIETRPVARLLGRDGAIEGVALADGAVVPCNALFAHPPQRQVEVVRALGLALDEHGFVKIDPMTRETSVPGVYAGGDLVNRMQGAIFAAAAGTQAAAMVAHELIVAEATGQLT